MYCRFFCQKESLLTYLLIYLCFMNCLLIQTKIFLLKLDIRKDVVVLVNKKLINKSSFKNVFLRF